MIKFKFPLLNFIAHAQMNLMTLWLDKKVLMLMLVESQNNAFEIGHVGDNLARVKDELHRISKYTSMVANQAEQVLKAQNDLLDELNNKHDFAVRVATRTGRMTQEPLYP